MFDILLTVLLHGGGGGGGDSWSISAILPILPAIAAVLGFTVIGVLVVYRNWELLKQKPQEEDGVEEYLGPLFQNLPWRH